MDVSEISEIMEDINDAFADFGTVGNKENIEWLKPILAVGDVVYNQNTAKTFTSHPMIGLATGRVPKDELTVLGIDVDIAERMYVVNSYFTLAGITPEEGDRIKHRGVVYRIVKLKPTSISDMDVLWRAIITEAPIAAQSVEERETEDPYYQIDAAHDEANANTSGVNDAVYTNVPATVSNTILSDEYEIITGVNDKLKMAVNGGVAMTLTFAEGIKTPATLVAEMQSLFNTNFGIGVITATLLETGYIQWQTVATGQTASLEIMSVNRNIYLEVGYKVGIKEGARMDV